MAAGLLSLAAVAGPTDAWKLPVEIKKLDNGLTVVVSEDHSSPTVGIAVIYKVGIRTEPRGRTGFAHLFEHLMFEGTPDAPQGVFDRVVTDGGGDNNGSTHPDFTSYIERAPASALQALLWLEADRMQTLAFTQAALDGQRDVVKEEIRVNVLNQPYGGFAQTDLPALAFSRWENAHDGYGSFDDLDKATLADVRAFHRDFYGPNDAVLAIAGDVAPAQGFALAQKYFGAIPSRATPPAPNVDEPAHTGEKRNVEGDGLAKLPALAIGWKMPPRGSHDQAAMIVLGELLAGGGDASRLYQALVKGSALAVQVEDFTGSASPWEYAGPTLYTLVVTHKVDAKADAVLAAIDAQIARIVKEGVDPATLQGVKTRLLADWYDDLEPFMDRAEHLAILQATWGDAGVANKVPDWIDAVTSADVQRVAATWMTRDNRSSIERVPDFMLKANDPARSDRRVKAKPAPAPPKPHSGTVTVGAPQEVPALKPEAVPKQDAVSKPEAAPKQKTTPKQTPTKPDAGAPAPVGGPSRPDAGVPVAVGGPSRPDAGVPVAVGGPSRPDAGVPIAVGGPSRPDAGVPVAVGGPSRPDAGVPVAVGGLPDPMLGCRYLWEGLPGPMLGCR
ncbi:MAG: insulinase family protein [Proteobacteria bacterium]|nr:insulinase family protein [Pseudomonadota bacterium]